MVLNFFVVPAAPLTEGFVKMSTLFALITFVGLPCSILEFVVCKLLSAISYLKSLLSSELSFSSDVSSLICASKCSVETIFHGKIHLNTYSCS